MPSDASDAASPRVVFLGDSLTEGTHGASYLAVLRRMLAETTSLSSVKLVNAGVGGDTVGNLLPRVARDVAPHDPDWVVVFIGTNDCTTWLIRHGLWRRLVFWRAWRYFPAEKGVTTPMTPLRFEAGLRRLITELRRQSRARVALCTPPPPGIEPRSLRWRLMESYVEVIRRVAAQMDCGLIDLYARWSALARSLPRRTVVQRLRSLAGEVWGDGGADIETMARDRGYALTFDAIHFSAKGATLAADVMRNWLATV
jgi:lysophospholipase L1-like esterase